MPLVLPVGVAALALLQSKLACKLHGHKNGDLCEGKGGSDCTCCPLRTWTGMERPVVVTHAGDADLASIHVATHEVAAANGGAVGQVVTAAASAPAALLLKWVQTGSVTAPGVVAKDSPDADTSVLATVRWVCMVVQSNGTCNLRFGVAGSRPCPVSSSPVLGLVRAVALHGQCDLSPSTWTTGSWVTDTSKTTASALPASAQTVAVSIADSTAVFKLKQVSDLERLLASVLLFVSHASLCTGSTSSFSPLFYKDMNLVTPGADAPVAAAVPAPPVLGGSGPAGAGSAGDPDPEPPDSPHLPPLPLPSPGSPAAPVLLSLGVGRRHGAAVSLARRMSFSEDLPADGVSDAESEVDMLLLPKEALQTPSHRGSPSRPSSKRRRHRVKSLTGIQSGGGSTNTGSGSTLVQQRHNGARVYLDKSESPKPPCPAFESVFRAGRGTNSDSSGTITSVLDRCFEVIDQHVPEGSPAVVARFSTYSHVRCCLLQSSQAHPVLAQCNVCYDWDRNVLRSRQQRLVEDLSPPNLVLLSVGGVTVRVSSASSAGAAAMLSPTTKDVVVRTRRLVESQ